VIDNKPNALLLTDRQATDADIDAAMDACRHAFPKRRWINSRDLFKQRIAHDGSWADWTRATAKRFNLYVRVNQGKVGKANAEILMIAKNNGAALFLIEDDHLGTRRLESILRIDCHDQRDSQAGWHLVLASEGE
jgi:hypothetical protein